MMTEGRHTATTGKFEHSCTIFGSQLRYSRKCLSLLTFWNNLQSRILNSNHSCSETHTPDRGKWVMTGPAPFYTFGSVFRPELRIYTFVLDTIIFRDCSIQDGLESLHASAGRWFLMPNEPHPNFLCQLKLLMGQIFETFITLSSAVTWLAVYGGIRQLLCESLGSNRVGGLPPVVNALTRI